ncbi:MAG: hypothetical protein Q8R08_00055 [bacterium]|nr:hypothetical protein [bacterium]
MIKLIILGVHTLLEKERKMNKGIVSLFILIVILVSGILIPNVFINDIESVEAKSAECVKIEAAIFFDNPVEKLFITKFAVTDRVDDRLEVSAFSFFGIPYQKLVTGCPPDPIQTADIKYYLEQNLVKPSFGGKVFCSFREIGTDTRALEMRLALWALCQEYYLENGALQSGTGSFVPVSLVAITEKDQHKIVRHLVPRDAPMYFEDVKEFFPEPLHKQILNFSPEADWIDMQIQQTRQDAEVYFKLLK